MDVDEDGVSVSTPGWPWPAPSVISPASLGLRQEQQQHPDLSSTHPRGNSSPHFLQRYDYNQLEGQILHPQQPPASSISPTQDFPLVPPAPSTQPNPKVAIPRSAGTESASHHRRRSARACEPCRVRKIKCDGNKPVCRQCVENHVSCTYMDVKRVREQKQLGVLSRRVERYGELLKELEPEVVSGAARKIRRALKVFPRLLPLLVMLCGVLMVIDEWRRRRRRIRVRQFGWLTGCHRSCGRRPQPQRENTRDGILR